MCEPRLLLHHLSDDALALRSLRPGRCLIVRGNHCLADWKQWDNFAMLLLDCAVTLACPPMKYTLAVNLTV